MPTIPDLLKPLAVLGALLGLAACETVEGAGQDIQKAGWAVEQAAEEADG